MEKPLALLMALLLLLTSASRVRGQTAGSTVSKVEFPSQTLQRTYEFNLYLPVGYDEAAERIYPVIYLLHGRGDTLDAWLTVRDTLDQLIASGDIPPIIAVMPDMPSNERAGYYIDSQYTGGEAVETAFLNDLIPYIDLTYHTATNREARLVGGYSMGGYGALRYALAYPEKFGGALVLSPAVYIPLPPADSSTREFGAFGQGDQLFDETIYQSLNYPALLAPFRQSAISMPMFIAVGDDEYKNPKPEDALHDLDMEAHMLFNQVARVPGIIAEFRVYNGGHDWDVWRTGFIEGMKYLANYISTGSSPTAAPLTGTLLGSAGEDYAGGVAADEDGNVYQALSASGSINGETYLGDLDAVLVKYAPDGSTLWTRQFGTAAADRIYALAVDLDDNAFVAGYTSGDLDGQHADNSANDAFVAKFNPDGQQEWLLQFGDAAEADRVYAIVVDEDGYADIAGYTKGTLEGANAGDKDVFVAQITPDGELEWLHQIGGVGEDKALGITTHEDRIYVTGVTGSTLATSAGDADGFLIAYSTAGRQVWLQQFGSAAYDESASVVVANEEIVVTGFTAGDFDGHQLIGDKDIIVASFNFDGSLLWSDQVGTPLNDKGAAVTADSAGNVVVAAFSNGGLAGSAGAFDVLLLQYFADHTSGWVRQLGTNDDDGADAFAERNLYVTFAGEKLLISGLTKGSVGDTSPFGEGDIFMTELSE